MMTYKEAMQQVTAQRDEAFLNEFCSTPKTLGELVKETGFAHMTVYKRVQRFVNQGRLRVLPHDPYAPKRKGPPAVRFVKAE